MHHCQSSVDKGTTFCIWQHLIVWRRVDCPVPIRRLHFKHTHTVMFNHILTSQICPITVSLSATGARHPTAILGWRQAMLSSTTLSYQSCIGCHNSKLCQYKLILGCQLFKFEN